MKEMIGAAMLLCILGVASNAHAQDMKGEVPELVLHTFNKQYPHATNAKWEAEPDGTFEVEFQEAAAGELEAVFQADGRLLYTKKEVAVDALPEKVRSSVAKEWPDLGIREAGRLDMADGSTRWELELKGAKGEVEVILSEDCKVLSKEMESDDEDSDEEDDD
ncbi:MAG: hypothetical protein KDB88_13930 [Flavobacteriales bacterium]|nr:hypothetical protein [Flavobacteriales bacterium]